ncbi:MAG TPA: iron uptake system protein EfeO [Streptosporangiaceae bacterium]
MSSDGMRWRRRGAAAAIVAASLALVASGCASSGSGAKAGTGAAAAAGDKSSTVKIELTSQGCQPKPASVPAGAVEFDVSNSGAGAVTEAELRTSDLAHILGEQENLTPGLSGGFSLTIRPGTYKINCPGASQAAWTFKVTGKAAGPAWQNNPQLTSAVQGYSAYVKQNTTDLVTKTQAFCKAISAGNMNQAKQLYTPARMPYEKIEPVAEVWGGLDTSIDGRWENPVTVKSQFTGFHRIEQMLWQDKSLNGAAAMCSGLVKNEQQLLTLVSAAQYNPLEMASGATDLINEAGTNKISGEEERYSNTDLPVFEANVQASMQVIDLLSPYLQTKAASTVSLIKQRNGTVQSLLTKYQVKPGYENTGYVDYSTVTKADRKQLSAAVNALAEAMSKVSSEVSA